MGHARGQRRIPRGHRERHGIGVRGRYRHGHGGRGSVDTKQKKRDEHLRSAHFFDVASTPDITFTAEQVTPSGAGVTVTGALTVRDRTRPVTFPARVTVLDGTQVELDGELQVNRSDFGLTWNQLGMVSVHNTITVHAVFTRQ